MRRGAEVDVAMQARLDYIASLREAENVRVTGDLLRDVDERLRLTREMFDGGRVPRFYVLRDETERANVLQMDAMARSRAEQALIALKTTLGVDLSSPITLADPLQYLPATVSVEEGIRQAGDDASRPPDGDQAAGGGPGRGARRLRQLLPPGLGELHVRRHVVEESQRGVHDRRRILGRASW